MIYFDNAATTPIIDECIEIVTRYDSQCFFNPSARYSPSVGVLREIEKARETISNVLNCKSSELFFTSSGSEADNWAIKGVIKRTADRLIVSEAEHPAVYNTALYLKNKGYDVQFCKVDGCGRVDEESLISLLTPNTKLVSIMHVNNETGAINDIQRLVKIVKSRSKAYFHSDGVQAFSKINVDVEDLGVDLYTISGHKIHAPKGIAGLYVKKGVSIDPLIHGGGQESGMRSSTENVSGIIAFAKAVEIAKKSLKNSQNDLLLIKNYIKSALSESFSSDILWITPDDSSPYILYMSIKGIRGEVLLHSLETEGIYVSTGSACSSKKGISRLGEAIGLKEDFREGTLRLSFSRYSTLDEAKTFVEKVTPIVRELIKYRRK